MKGVRPGRLLREAGAMLTQARYLGRDWATHSATRSDSGYLVLLHGLYASAGVFRPMRRALEAGGNLGVSTFSYLPGPGIEELTQRLSKLIAEIEGPGPVVLIGHSLGGLVIRNFVRRAELDSRIVQTISLAAPFRGSGKYRLVPGQAGRDLVPDARILEPLRRRDVENLRVPHLTLVAEEDEMIEGGAFPDYGKYQQIPAVGHNGILFSSDAIEAVCSAVALHMSSRSGG